MDSSGTSSRPSGAEYAADWYPDPAGRFEFRYHNGRDWTGDVSVDGQRFLDPLPRPDLDQSYGGHDRRRSGPALVAHNAHRSSRSTAAMVLGIGSVAAAWVPFFFVLAVVAAILALVFGIPVLRKSRRGEVVERRERGFALTGVVLAPIGLALCGVGWWLTVVTYREVDRFTDVGEHTVVGSSCVVNDGVATYSGTITNLSGDTRSYHVTVSFLRPHTDNVLYNGGTDADDVPAGATDAWSVNVVVREDELECEIKEVSGPLPFGQS